MESKSSDKLVKPKPCEHEYKKFKQTIRTTNDKFTGTAYFIVQGCIKCKDKKILDYVVEKG